MTDQTGAGQQSASSGRTGDVDVADDSRPDLTTDVQTGGASDVGRGGPELSSAGDESAARGPEDVDAPRRDERDAGRVSETADDEGTTGPDADATANAGATADAGTSGGEEDDRAAAEERQKSAAEFAHEHDPAQHDVSAGEEFRQSGDWTADDAGGPQVWDAEGNLVEGSAPGQGSFESTAGERDRTQ